MKKFLLFISLMGFTAGLQAQCPSGTITLTTQAEVNTFASTYPACTELPGALLIGDFTFPFTGSDISDLSSLSNLNSIGGRLTILRNSLLTSLAGLENINSIEGNLAINRNSSLTSLAALENINSIEGNLAIFSNSSLTSLAALENINSIEGNLAISSNGSLTSLAGLENLNSIGGFLQISSNGSLTSLTGLENLNSIGGFLQISSNGSLTSLTGLENLNSIGSGFLEIRSNISLTNCSIDAVCDKLEAPNAFILIFSNAPGCNSPAEVEDNCGSALEALCQNTSVSLQPGGTATIMASDVDGGSSGFTNISVSPSTFNCDNLGANVVTLTVDDGNGNSDDCPATVTVTNGGNLPGNWQGTDIGNVTAGNAYSFDACGATGDQFAVSGSGNNATSFMTDNIAFASQTLCGDGSITAKIENVDASGYGGLMIRETTAAGSKQVAIFSNMSSILRHESRTMTNMPKTIQSFFKPSPIWLRMRRQGDWVHVEYSNNGMMYLPVQSTFVMMSSCVEIGLASFIFLPMGQTAATFSNVSTTGNIITMMEQEVEAAEMARLSQTKSEGGNAKWENPAFLPNSEFRFPISVFPNPTRNTFTLQLEAPLQEDALVEVINLYGQPLAQQRLVAGEVNQQWNTADWPAGTYLVRINQAGQAPLVKQFVVLK